MRLGPTAERRLGVRLRHLEEQLAAVDHLLVDREEGILYRRDPAAIDPVRRVRLHELLAACRGEIGALATAYELPREEHDARRTIVGVMAMAWQSLGDLRGGAGGAWRGVPAEERSRIEASVERLMELVLEIERGAGRDA